MAQDIEIKFVIKKHENLTIENLLKFAHAAVEQGWVTLDDDVFVYDRQYKPALLNSLDDVVAGIQSQEGKEDPPYLMFNFSGLDSTGPNNGIAELATEIVEATDELSTETGDTSASIYSASISKTVLEFMPGEEHIYAAFDFSADGQIDGLKVWDVVKSKPRCSAMAKLLAECFESDIEFAVDPVM